eukprot:jgi/Undpi1/5777/HiC_scaffold_2.g01051.m1
MRSPWSDPPAGAIPPLCGGGGGGGVFRLDMLIDFVARCSSFTPQPEVRARHAVGHRLRLALFSQRGSIRNMGDEELLHECNSLGGAWVLDLSRSDTLEGYLQCLLTPEMAIQAQVAGEQAYRSRNVIALDESTFVIGKRTAVNNFTETFALDHEQVKHTSSGVKRSRASLGEDGDLDEVVIVTTMLRPGGSSVIVVEARKLLNRGQIHQQSTAVLPHEMDLKIGCPTGGGGEIASARRGGGGGGAGGGEEEEEEEEERRRRRRGGGGGAGESGVSHYAL